MSFPGLLLLMAYIIGCLEASISKTHHHHSEICEHDESEVGNACHMKLVHGDQETGCRHPEHLQNHESECSLCDLDLNFDQLSWPGTEFSFLSALYPEPLTHEALCPIRLPIAFLGRAPPTA